MVVDRDSFIAIPTPADAALSFAAADDPDLPTILAVAHVGFDAPGTAVGREGPETVPAVAAAIPRASVDFQRQRIEGGRTIVAVVRAAALTAALTRDAFERGVETVLLSAGSAEVARVYAGVGFRQVGTVAEAGPSRR
jgi:hypothetical protein